MEKSHDDLDETGGGEKQSGGDGDFGSSLIPRGRRPEIETEREEVEA